MVLYFPSASLGCSVRVKQSPVARMTQKSCVRMGINNDSSTSSAAVQNTPVDIPSVPQQQTSKRKLNDNEHDIRPAKRIFDENETEETKRLNFQQLQRLVLLKQNKVLSLKLKVLEDRVAEKELNLDEY
ncbi:uncharacterized protein LOC128867303 [Anastrepha ludens]|uniref:uncharacterized protein LOC128867303 n=1 Tax=Anastrepha ludens TaxID=28586 RepID=UPI0023B1567B|nr:uncharacterized protein LOC128867303 [Anastrepha ludens]